MPVDQQKIRIMRDRVFTTLWLCERTAGHSWVSDWGLLQQLHTALQNFFTLTLQDTQELGPSPARLAVLQQAVVQAFTYVTTSAPRVSFVGSPQVTITPIAADTFRLSVKFTLANSRKSIVLGTDDAQVFGYWAQATSVAQELALDWIQLPATLPELTALGRPVVTLPPSPLVYVSAPYAHAQQIVMQQRLGQLHMVLPRLRRHTDVFSALLYSMAFEQAGGPAATWDTWQNFCKTMLQRCDRLVVVAIPGWHISNGVRVEVLLARELRIPIDVVTMDVQRYVPGSWENDPELLAVLEKIV